MTRCRQLLLQDITYFSPVPGSSGEELGETDPQGYRPFSTPGMKIRSMQLGSRPVDSAAVKPTRPLLANLTTPRAATLLHLHMSYAPRQDSAHRRACAVRRPEPIHGSGRRPRGPPSPGIEVRRALRSAGPRIIAVPLEREHVRAVPVNETLRQAETILRKNTGRESPYTAAMLVCPAVLSQPPAESYLRTTG